MAPRLPRSLIHDKTFDEGGQLIEPGRGMNYDFGSRQMAYRFIRAWHIPVLTGDVDWIDICDWPNGRVMEVKRRARTGNSKILCAAISPEHYARLHEIAGERSLGLTLEHLIDSRYTLHSAAKELDNPISMKIPAPNPAE